MIKIKNIDIFTDILDKMDKSSYHLFGNIQEYGSSVHAFGSDNPKTRLAARIVALTPTGAIYFEESVKLNEEEALINFKEKLSLLPVEEANVRLDSSSGIITVD